MLKRLIWVALAAGLSAGFVVLAVQALWLLPLIDFAEFLESSASPRAYAPPEGLFAVALSDPERLTGTFTFDILTAVAYALMMSAAMTLDGRPLDWKRGLLWGLAGWAVFSLAPAIGQPPNPPGAAYVDLEARQIWWWLAVSSTAAGLALVAFSRPLKQQWWPKVLGVALLALPHVVGAPGGAEYIAALPGNLARDFAVASIVSAGVMWLVIGGMLGLMLRPSRKP